ncbi:hypothetical protein ACWD7M_38045, partial [Streptomyces griseus]
YTDGITEAKGGPMGDALFGEGRLKRALTECAADASRVGPRPLCLPLFPHRSPTLTSSRRPVFRARFVLLFR